MNWVWAMVAVMALVVVVGVPFTLWWWRQADKWMDAEHRRFRAPPADARPRVVVRDRPAGGE